MQSTAAKVAAGPCVIILHGRGQVNGFLRPQRKGMCPGFCPLPPAQNSTLHLPARAGALSGNTQLKGLPPIWQAFHRSLGRPGFAQTKLRSPPGVLKLPSAARKFGVSTQGPNDGVCTTKLNTSPRGPELPNAVRKPGVGFGGWTSGQRTVRSRFSFRKAPRI